MRTRRLVYLGLDGDGASLTRSLAHSLAGFTTRTTRGQSRRSSRAKRTRFQIPRKALSRALPAPLPPSPPGIPLPSQVKRARRYLPNSRPSILSKTSRRGGSLHRARALAPRARRLYAHSCSATLRSPVLGDSTLTRATLLRSPASDGSTTPTRTMSSTSPTIPATPAAPTKAACPRADTARQCVASTSRTEISSID